MSDPEYSIEKFARDWAEEEVNPGALENRRRAYEGIAPLKREQLALEGLRLAQHYLGLAIKALETKP